MPADCVSDRYMNEAMIGYSSGPGVLLMLRMSDAMSGAASWKFNPKQKFEQEFLEYMKGKWRRKATTRHNRVCVWSRLQRANLPTPKRRLLASFNR